MADETYAVADVNHKRWLMGGGGGGEIITNKNSVQSAKSGAKEAVH